jgi:hypothetical protein
MKAKKAPSLTRTTPNLPNEGQKAPSFNRTASNPIYEVAKQLMLRGGLFSSIS